MLVSLGVLLQAAAVSTALVAPRAVTVRAPDHTATVPVVAIAGRPAVDGARLAAALGGTFRPAGRGRFLLTLGEWAVRFTDGLPFATVDDTSAIPMTDAPRTEGPVMYLPFQVVSEIIPRFLSGFFYDPGAAEVRVFNPAARRIPPVDATPPPAADTGAAVLATAPVNAIALPRHRDGRHLVVVDAGHGGPDNGMTGPIGTSPPTLVEKNITLAVAKLVAADLRAAGTDVLMTRTTDTLIALSDRGRIANRHHGDVFVSIHVNATGQRGPTAARERGFETYFLAEAKTEDARRVERMENESVKFETGVNAPKGDALGFIINDMAQNEHLRESEKLAQMIQDGLRGVEPGPDRGVQQANFAVLRGSYMPAVLVEIGFGTNPAEAAYLRQRGDQRSIAASITRSVLAYLDQYDARVGAGR